MPINTYLLAGQYDFREIPVTLNGSVDIDESGYLTSKIKECYYKNSELHFWGALKKINGIIRFVLFENPIKLDSPNIVYYLENEAPSKDPKTAYDGLYYGGKFDNVKANIPEKIAILGEERIIEYVLSEMDFCFDEEGYAAAIMLKKSRLR